MYCVILLYAIIIMTDPDLRFVTNFDLSGLAFGTYTLCLTPSSSLNRISERGIRDCIGIFIEVDSLTLEKSMCILWYNRHGVHLV